MFKVTPNPPATPNAVNIDSLIADRALSHYDLGPKVGSKPVPVSVLLEDLPLPKDRETTLLDVYSILQSAAATAYENADNQTGPNRKVAMGVVHLIELAQLRMDAVLNEQMVSTSG
ncbi:DUF6124 family protein [Pseudomonas gingeri]|uniref:DUF3077 domain-containing protein n=1 Tax=Pseudomonas gingeri TaxID=117681 RepID=A0A7Y7YJ25_9PSED|nr:hypothetical protein [Pseudomonas gingeri]NWB32073.1 hypothetical protein [Pseudomonas gingeri]NWC37449.1 hypothetical protein [Pseudomonas gingeri]